MNDLRSYEFLVLVFAALIGYWLPLSLALSREGRGEECFECIERCLSVRGIKLFVRAGA